MRNVSRHIVFLYCGLLITSSYAQIGRLGTYDFLQSPPGARAAALQSALIANRDSDIATAFLNPAILNTATQHQLSLHHSFHLADINYGHMAYGLAIRDINLLLGARYVDYGDFTRSNLYGNTLGSFSSRESAFTIGTSRSLDERLTLGINVHLISGQLENYTSFGLGSDIGVIYQDSAKRSSVAIVLKNIGGQLSSYDGTRENLPFDFQVGYQKRLKHLPFRWMITAHHLHIWDLRSPLDNQSSNTTFGDEGQRVSSFSKGVDNFFRHLNFGGELLLGKNENVQIRFGYSPLRARELSIEGYRSFNGFSLGFGVQIRKLRFHYSFSNFHQAGRSNHLSLQIDLKDLFRKI